MNHTRVWQCEMNQASEREIAWHLVGDACRLRRFAANSLNVTSPEPAQFIGRYGWYEVGIRWTFGTANTRCKFPNLAQLAGAEHLWMARENLLNQRRAGPWHAEYEYR